MQRATGTWHSSTGRRNCSTAEYGPAVRALDAFERARTELGMAGPASCCDDAPAAARWCIDQIYADNPQVTAILTINEQALSGVLFAPARTRVARAGRRLSAGRCLGPGGDERLSAGQRR